MMQVNKTLHGVSYKGRTVKMTRETREKIEQV
jgi:hypothetical protein